MLEAALFALTNVAKRYVRGGETMTIFEDLTMEIPVGAFISIMGPSGSGKSTLLNLLGGIDAPTEGEILFEGTERVDRMGQAKLSAWRADNVGFVFQFYNLMPSLSAARNVELPLILTKLSGKERRKRVETALDIVGLSDRARHKPRELSGGQQQRVAIARAIVADPKVLLCDEPTGDLDRATADEILKTLQLLNAELNKTLIMVTHDPAAAKFARTQLYLDKGQFVAQELAA